MDSGWRVIRGAGGFVAKHSGKDKWSTSVFRTQAEAEAAAVALERGALATGEKRERERDELRRFYRSNHAVHRNERRD